MPLPTYLNKLKDLYQKVTHLETSSHSLTSSTTNHNPLHPPPSFLHMKLEVSPFEGSDPFCWIFKINQFFAYHDTPKPDSLTIASFYMGGLTFAWFQWMSQNDQLSSWTSFLQALEAWFAPSQYEDPTGTLFKLTQRGTITEYFSEFESLANCIVGLPPTFLLRCFVSGLAPEIRREVQALQPLTMVQATTLAHL